MEALNTTPTGVFFDPASETHAYGSRVSLSALPERVAEHPLLDEAAWIALRDSGRVPYDATEMVTTFGDRAEFLTGAWLLDKIVPPVLGGSLLASIKPQMLKTADVLAAGRFKNGVLEPRRSSKTTSLWCVLAGRCYLRDVHMAGYTMLTTAKKTTERFRLDIYGPIVRQWPNAKTRPVKVINSNGFERVEFDNGSVLAILSPEGDAVRSGAYDDLVADEGGEPEPDKWDDFSAAVVPSFDTRPGGQLIVAGTGGRYRTGSWFWKVLHDPEAGRVRFGVPDDIDPTLFESWATTGPLIEAIHPGLDGLTNLAKIESNYHDLGPEKFAREYLGHFGDEHGTQTAITAAAWKRGLQPGAVPEGVTTATLAISVHPFGHSASIAVAWHHQAPDDLASVAWELDGITETKPARVGIKLIHHQRGVEGLERVLLAAARRLGTAIVYDHGTSQSRAVVERVLARSRPKPGTIPYQLGDVKVAHAQLLNGLEHGTIIHWEQAPLDRAAATVVRASMGQGFLIRAPKGDDTADATPFEAAAMAAHALPEMPQQAVNPAAVIEFN